MPPAPNQVMRTVSSSVRTGADSPPGSRPPATSWLAESLTEMLGDDVLTGRTFLDLGSGSGLFSLAAVELGAEHVHSLDYDPASVATARQLKERYAPEADWTIEEASVLERKHMAALGQSDVVYSWASCTTLATCGPRWISPTIESAPEGPCSFRSTTTKGLGAVLGGLVKRTYNRLPHCSRLRSDPRHPSGRDATSGLRHDQAAPTRLVLRLGWRSLRRAEA